MRPDELMTAQTDGRARLVGTSTVRLDGAAKASGAFEYGHDLTAPGMLHAKLRRADIAHGRILRIDTSRAEQLSGVRCVLTGADIGDLRASRYVHDEPILATERVRYVGEPLAAVAADSVEVAEAAVELIDVEYAPLPVVATALEAFAEDAPLLHPDWESYWSIPVLRRRGNILNHASLARGDVDRLFDEAAHVFEDRYESQHVHQVSLEGRVALASWDNEGRVHVTTSHQFPFGLRQDLADILQIPLSKIRVSLSGMGGGFGGKLFAGVEPYCILLSQRTGRPVKLQHTREEELIATSPRMAANVHVRTAVSADGRLLAREGTLHYDAGAYAESSPSVVSVGLMTLPGPYRWQGLRIDSYAMYTNKANCGSYRGPGAPQAVFAGECQIDRIAKELGADPLEFRLANAVEDGDLGPTGQVLTGVSLKETLQRAADRIGWQDPAGDGRGKGLACCWWTTTGGATSAYVRVDESGNVILTTGATEIGTGALQAGVAQVCADELGIDLDALRIVSGDTDATPYDFGAQGSRTTVQTSTAVRKACDDLKQQLFALAADKLDCPPDELEYVDGEVRRPGHPGVALDLAQLASLGGSRGGLLGRASHMAPATEFDESSIDGATITAFNDPSFSTHAAEVEIDEETGVMRLVRYVAVQDVGFAINPLYAAGQVAGGAVQGIGQAAFEELVYRDGRILNPNLTDYKIPTLMDVPEIEVDLVEHRGLLGPWGAKGIGEPSIVPPPAVLGNAVHDAVGVWVRQLPITAERIHGALQEHRPSTDPDGDS